MSGPTFATSRRQPPSLAIAHGSYEPSHSASPRPCLTHSPNRMTTRPASQNQAAKSHATFHTVITTPATPPAPTRSSPTRPTPRTACRQDGAEAWGLLEVLLATSPPRGHGNCSGLIQGDSEGGSSVRWRTNYVASRW